MSNLSLGATMPKSKAARKRYQQKRKALKKLKAKVADVVTQPVAGGGKYTRVPVRRLRGSGGYLNDVVDAVSGVANYAPSSKVGRAAQSGVSAVANDLGVPKSISGALGNAAGWLTKLFGFGAYSTYNKVKSNSFLNTFGGGTGVSGFITNAPPTFAGSAKQTTIRFRHDEFVADVLSSVAFRKTSYVINAGSNVLFPWGSQVASLYEEYRIHGLVFEYRPTSAAAVGTTSSAMGTVIQATDYDAYDDSFVDKRSMENSMFATSCAPYEGAVHPVECDRTMNPVNLQYIIRGNPPITALPGDARLDILGTYSIATEGQQVDNTNIGELWVHYDVELSRPMLENSALNFTQHVSMQATSGSSWTVTANSNNTNGFNISWGSGGSWNEINMATTVVPNGTYLIVARTTASNGVNGFVNPTTALVGDDGAVNVVVADATNTVGQLNAATLDTAIVDGGTNVGIASCLFTVAGSGGVMHYWSAYTNSGTNYVDLYITGWENASGLRYKRSTPITKEVSALTNEMATLKAMVKKLLGTQCSASSSNERRNQVSDNDEEESAAVPAVREKAPSTSSSPFVRVENTVRTDSTGSSSANNLYANTAPFVGSYVLSTARKG